MAIKTFSMKQAWVDIKLWIEENAPHLFAYLAPPATTKDIQEAEEKLSIKFTDGFKEFYMIHNGQINESESLIHEQAILSLERIMGEWQAWTDLLNGDEFIYDGDALKSDPDIGVKNDWWNTKWIPITSNGCGDNFCVDTDPDDGGKVGQVISMWHDAGWRELKADSFENWVIQYSNDLKEGKYYYKSQLGIWKKRNI
jgi:cell wall assembly regulator SMI1